MNIEMIKDRIEILSFEINKLTSSRNLEAFEIDHGDIALMFAATALVFCSTTPGISLFYAGNVKVKHTLATYIQCICIGAVVTVTWQVLGYSLAFAPSIEDSKSFSFIGDSSQFWLHNIRSKSYHRLAPYIPETLFCAFQLSKAVTGAAFNIGGFAGRVKLLAFMLFSILWTIVIYCPIIHTHEHPNGFLNRAGVLDCAGGHSVYIASGVTSWIASKFIGPPLPSIEHHETRNIFLSVWGVCMIFIGTLGFNMGTSYVAGPLAGNAVLMTIIATGISSLAWMSTEIFYAGRISVIGMLKGSLSGIAAISTGKVQTMTITNQLIIIRCCLCMYHGIIGCAYVDRTGAFVIGFMSGIICCACDDIIIKYFKMDDTLTCFSLNFLGGLVGSILLGFFAHTNTYQITKVINGAFYGNPWQIVLQLYGISFTVVYTALTSFLILKLIDLTFGLRVTEEQELVGLDISTHLETIVALPAKKLELLKSRVHYNEKARIDDELDAPSMRQRRTNISNKNDEISDYEMMVREIEAERFEQEKLFSSPTYSLR